MRDTHRAVKLLKQLQEQREPKWEIIQAVLGNGDGSTVNVPGRDGYDYVRLHGLDNELAIYNTSAQDMF